MKEAPPYSSGTHKLVETVAKVPYAHELYREARIGIRTAWRFVPRLVTHLRTGGPIVAEQQVISWSDVLCDVSSTCELRHLLEENRIAFQEGDHCLYVPPQPRLASLLGKCIEFYPTDAGFKIFKHPCNDSPRDAQSSSQVRESALYAALILNALNLGPRIYDFTRLQTGRANFDCLVVEHVHGKGTGLQQTKQFQLKLEALLRNAGLDPFAFANGDRRRDGRPPSVLERSSDGSLLYVGSGQSTAMQRRQVLQWLLETGQDRLHFGGSRLHRRHRYLYQSVPGLKGGKRDMTERWVLFTSLLQRCNIDLHRRTVMDICCNSGMILGLALHAGSSWTMGWDLPEVAAKAEQIQLLLGNTRRHCIGARLNEAYELSKDIPSHLQGKLSGSVVFLLAAWRYVGFMSDLGKIPWSALVYEGHEKDTADETRRNYATMQSRWNCQLALAQRMSDGDCGERDIAIFVRR